MGWVKKLSIADSVYLILMLLVILTFVIRYNKIKKEIQPLLFFIVLHFFLEFGSSYMFYALKQENMILYHLFAPLGYIVLCVFFYGVFTHIQQKRNVAISIPVYLLIVIVLTVFLEPVDRMNSVSYMTESLLIIYWCFTFFRTVLQRTTSYRPEYDPIFWIVVGFLFYFTGNFFTVGSLNYFITNTQRELATKVYYASYGFNYVLYVTIGVVLLINFPDRKHE